MPKSTYRLLPFAAAGETHVLFPVWNRVAWAQIHRHGFREAPCVGADCPCVTLAPPSGRAYWLGFLLVAPAWQPNKLAVARLLPQVYDACADLSAGSPGLRGRLLRLACMAGKGARRLTCQLEYSEDVPDDLPLPLYTLRETLTAVWTLPEDEPDYRAAVYFRWAPREAPTRQSRLLTWGDVCA